MVNCKVGKDQWMGVALVSMDNAMEEDIMDATSLVMTSQCKIASRIRSEQKTQSDDQLRSSVYRSR